jgi:hypothetical protein
MDDLRHYLFRTIWTVDAEPSVMYEILKDVPSYPKWFPLIKEVQERGHGKYWYRAKSILPYNLYFETEATIDDEVTGVLEGSMTGELVGFTRWTVTPRGQFSTIEYLEDVTTNKFLLDKLAPIAKPFFKLNHRLAMTQGQRSLRSYAAGYSAAKSL